jgi:hypothetical protein
MHPTREATVTQGTGCASPLRFALVRFAVTVASRVEPAHLHDAAQASHRYTGELFHAEFQPCVYKRRE